MMSHEFGIIPFTPEKGEDFSEYEPERYGCIRVPDSCVEELCFRSRELPTYFFRLGKRELGLNYYGVTLIPPESLPELEEEALEIQGRGMEELVELIRRARAEDRYVIHFGL